MVFNNNLLLGASGQVTGYDIEQSIRFNSGDSATMSRSFGTPTDRNKFTWSYWIKSTKEQNGVSLGINVSGGVTFASMIFNGGNMSFYDYTGGSANIDVRTTFTAGKGKFRDYSAWYNAMFVYDSDQSTDSDRLKFYINGTQFPAGDLVGPGGGSVVWPGSGADSKFNASGTTHLISDLVNGKIDGYMAEIYFIDGQALDPTSFGEVNSTTGQFVPIQYTGTFGNNGFYLKGEDSSDLGNDSSGNNNDFTTSGLSAADQVTDSPTDNFCVLSSLDNNSNFTLSDGNLTNSNGTNAHAACFSTIAFDASNTDGWYWEVTMDSMQSTGFAVLIADEAVNQTDITTDPTTQPAEGNLWAHRRYNSASDGAITGVGSTGSWTSYGPAAVNGDVIGYCVKNGKLFIAINNTWLESSNPATEANPAFSNLTGNLRVGVNRFADTGTDVTTLNFGQTGFTYTPPTGAKAISTANLPDPTIADPSAYFQTTTYTGDGSSSNEINQTGNSTFEPSMVWIKSRSAATDHVIQDQVRGNFIFYPNQNSAEGATGGGWVSSFDSDGFTVNVNGPINASGETFVGWQWKAAGSGSSNTDGSISSTVSADTTSGFSIATYTGTGANATVGHGLGVAPQMIIIKNRADADSWVVYHEDIGATKGLTLDGTAAATTASTFFNDTAPTSSVFTVGTGGRTNGSSDGMIAYCFTEVEGFSKFGSFTGNGSSTDGPFIYTGFKPEFFMWKRTDSSTNGDWTMMDTARDVYNMAEKNLRANSTMVEDSGEADLDFVSNGIKHRGGAAARFNASGATYIYMAFAESPFKTATAR